MNDHISPKLCTSPDSPTPYPGQIAFEGTTLDPETTRVICKHIYWIQYLVKKRQIKAVDKPDIFTAEDYQNEFYGYDLDEIKTLFELLSYFGFLMKITKKNDIQYALEPIADPVERVGPVQPIE